MRMVLLLLLAALFVGACADTNSRSRRYDSVVDLASTCAACGATVQDNYFAGSSFRAMGPGSY